MATTSSSSLRYPVASAVPNVPQDIQNLASDLDRKVIPPFSTVSARDAAIPSPTQGQCCTVAGNFHTYDGSSWRWQRRGYTSGVTDSGGNLVIPHSLGTTPTGVLLASGPQGSDLLNRVLTLNYTGSDGSNFVVYAHRDDTNAALPGNQIQVAWLAFK